MGKNAAIALGLALGLLFGLTAGLSGNATLLAVAGGVAPIGRAFINLIQMVVVPLVATSVFSGVATMGDLRLIGRNGGLAILFLWGTTLLAILTGMGVMAAALPLAGPSGGIIAGGAVVETTALPGAADFLLSLIPANAVRAAAEGALLPLMVFTVLFAAAAGTLPDEKRRPLVELSDAATQALIKLVHWVLWTAPIGVFALAAPVAATTGWGMLRSLGVFVGAVIVALIVFVIAVYLPAIRFWWRPGRHFLRANAITAPIAFSTTSSAATIPAMFEATEQVLHIPRSTTSLIIPLAAAVNRSGSALFQGAALVFLAHLYGTPFGLSALLGAVFATFLVALTIAPVPSASVMTLPPAMVALGIPLDGIAVLLGVDRIPDMFRTVVNVMGDVAAVAVVDGQTASGWDTSNRRMTNRRIATNEVR
ncbi:MAG: dicarboxylate/amino acid:cation symporter [Gemmatimonadales bacterium]